jgi:hypothetical protein
MLKFTNPPLHHVTGLAVITLGMPGLPLIGMVRAKLVAVGVQLLLLATTDKLPPANVGDTSINMLVLPLELALFMEVPVGNVHKYEVAPATLAMVYCTVELQMLLEGPVTVPGVAGVPLGIVLQRVCGVEQLLPAVTHTLGAPA